MLLGFSRAVGCASALGARGLVLRVHGVGLRLLDGLGGENLSATKNPAGGGEGLEVGSFWVLFSWPFKGVIADLLLGGAD